jgi:ferredoxin-like protein FixX
MLKFPILSVKPFVKLVTPVLKWVLTPTLVVFWSPSILSLQIFLKGCPAKVYTWEEAQQKIVVGYENCIECGAARMICPFNNIQWEPPRGGFGVNYKFG